jgi:hypothetical protein
MAPGATDLPQGHIHTTIGAVLIVFVISFVVPVRK